MDLSTKTTHNGLGPAISEPFNTFVLFCLFALFLCLFACLFVCLFVCLCVCLFLPANEPAVRRRSPGEAAENSPARRMLYAEKYLNDL